MTQGNLTQGKCLSDLAYEVDVLRRNIATVTDDQACISWQEDGTLCYFCYYDGYPGIYYAPWHVEDDPTDKREDYTTLQGMISMLSKFDDDEGIAKLLTAPMWRVLPPDMAQDDTSENRKAFNTLLSGIDINL